MARAFDITTTSPTLRLDGSRRGEVAFTVTNSLGQPVRGRAVIVPEGGTPPEWLSLVDEAERDFPRDGTHLFHTLEAWVRPTSGSGLQNIVARGYVLNPSGEIYLRILVGNYQVGSYMDGKAFGGASAPMPAEDANQWVHIAGVHDGQKWLLYRNGALLAEAPQPAGGAFPIRARWAIGARGGGGERAFNGNIRDVRIWSVARTQEQIKEAMSNPPAENAEGLSGYWPMDEGRTRRVVDHSGNEAHGFVHDSPWAPETPPQNPPPPQ